VYTDPDPRTYPFSSYGYLILPTTVGNGFSTAKGSTLAAFAYYAMCQGQQQSAALGYSPMPINLVQAAFAQIAKIPGANVQTINIQSCNNPTFTPSGQNLLALTAPYPPACDKQGPTQCTYGTGGAASVSTPDSGSPGAAAGSSSTTKSATGTAGSSGSAGAAGSGAASSGGSSQTTEVCDPTTGACTTGSDSGGSGGSSASPTALTDTLAAGTGWSTTQTLLLLIGLAVLALMLVPGLLSRYLERRRSSQ
jgi:phosphate transport system substrate-binding protein